MIYDIDYSKVSVNNNDTEWHIYRAEWVPMHEADRLEICKDHNNDEEDHSKCSQWLVLLVSDDEDDDEEDKELHAIPCAKDGSSLMDTPLLEFYDLDWDDFMVQISNGTAYKSE